MTGKHCAMPAAPSRPSTARLLGPLALAALAGCAGVAPAPIADRPIHLDARCEQQDINDFRERAQLAVTDGTVRALSWQLWVGNRGTCRFELADFRQVQSRPHVELLARDGSDCKLMIWQDGRRVTLGHAGCERRCSPGIADDAWPVMFDPRTGSCAQVQ
jgi:hypothetical protein